MDRNHFANFRPDDASKHLTWRDILPFNFYATHAAMNGDLGFGLSHPELLGDFVYAVGFAVLWFTVRHHSKKNLFGCFARAIGIKGRGRTDKCTYQLWLTLFYTASTVAGLLTVGNEEYFKFPLDARSGAYLFNHHPYQPTARMEWYIMYQAGFYMAEVVAIFLEPKRKDFLQYLVHHFVALFLLMGCYASDNHRIGIYINVIHDIPDIFLSAAKCLHYAKKNTEWVANGFFAVFVVSFAYFRLFCLPYATWVCMLVSPFVKPASYLFYIFIFLCGGVLQLLHIFWFYLILKMVLRLAMGVHGDVRSDDDDDDGEELKVDDKSCDAVEGATAKTLS